MNNKNNKIIKTTNFIPIGLGIFIILISGCIESDKEGKPLTVAGNATNESKIGDVNESGNDSVVENILDINLPDESNLTNRTPEPTLNISENLTETENESEKLEYLFNWDNVPGKGNAQFVRFLEDDLDIYWANNAKIKKSEDKKTITASYGRNSIKLELNEKENKINIEMVEIISKEDHEFVFKIENGKLNIYKPEPEPESQIKRIKFDIGGLQTSSEAHRIESKLRDFAGIIYTRIDTKDKNGEVLFDISIITKEKILKEAGYYKTAGGIIVMDLGITLTDEVNCTRNGELYCCGKDDCKLYA